MPEILAESDDWHFGHMPLNRRLNVRKELRRLRNDPLESFLRAVRGGEEEILRDDLDAYEQAYYFYYLSLSRFLPASSLAWRCQDMKWWPRKRGGAFKSSYHQKLGPQYKEALPFILYDLWGCLFHARILMDCTIRLSRLFLTAGNLPSFTSFSDHKRFFQKHLAAIEDHREYAAFIAEKTDWFDVPIKLVRDKFFVHAGPRHMRFLSFPGVPSGFEISLTILVPTKPREELWAKEMKHITVSIPRLMDDIDVFLHWFSDYGCAALRASPMTMPEDAS